MAGNTSTLDFASIATTPDLRPLVVVKLPPGRNDVLALKKKISSLGLASKLQNSKSQMTFGRVDDFFTVTTSQNPVFHPTTAQDGFDLSASDDQF